MLDGRLFQRRSWWGPTALDGRLWRGCCGWWTPVLHCAWWWPAEGSTGHLYALVVLLCFHGSNELCMIGVARICTRYSFCAAEFDNASHVGAIWVLRQVFARPSRQEMVVEVCRRAATGGSLSPAAEPLLAMCFIGP